LVVACCQPVFISLRLCLRPFVAVAVAAAGAAAAVVLVRCKLTNCIIFVQLQLHCGFTFAALSLHHNLLLPLAAVVADGVASATGTFSKPHFHLGSVQHPMQWPRSIFYAIKIEFLLGASKQL